MLQADYGFNGEPGCYVRNRRLLQQQIQLLLIVKESKAVAGVAWRLYPFCIRVGAGDGLTVGIQYLGKLKPGLAALETLQFGLYGRRLRGGVLKCCNQWRIVENFRQQVSAGGAGGGDVPLHLIAEYLVLAGNTVVHHTRKIVTGDIGVQQQGHYHQRKQNGEELGLKLHITCNCNDTGNYQQYSEPN